MTSREAYVFGWVFGRLNAEAPQDELGPNPRDAGMRPYSASAQIISEAHVKGVLRGDLDVQIGEALSEINSIEPEMSGGSEKVQPLEIQGSWQLGYYAGKGKHPLAAAGFDIAAARKAKKITQAQLADAMGVDQAVISRWESGKVSPSAENLKRLKDILA